MATFLVTHPGSSGATLRGGNAMIVSATDATDAKAIADSQYGGDSGGWAAATATALADVAVTAASSLTGWVFNIILRKTAETNKEFTLTATGAAQDTLDEIGTALATLLNTHADIANAAYDTATQILTVASIADGLGDWAVTITVKPPAVTDAGGQVNDPQDIPGFVDSIVDEGIAGAVLTITFAADTLIVPTVLAVVKTT